MPITRDEMTGTSHYTKPNPTPDKPWLIGFAGRKSSGKGTAALVFTEGYGFVEMNFADPLKQGVARMFGWSLNSMYDPTKKEVIDEDLGFSRRIAMQKVGTEGVRDGIGKDVWVKLMDRRITKECDMCVSKDNALIVIADVRMENEADLIRRRGGVVVHCLRPNSDTSDLHSTENGLTILPQDLQLGNNYGLVEFMDQCHSLAKAFGYF